MKRHKMLVGVSAVVALVGASSFSKAADPQTWTGTISDTQCRADHGGGEVDPKECTQKCIKLGEQYVLASRDGSKVFGIANQDFAGLADHAGDAVKVTGELRDGAIVIQKIE